MVKFDSKGVAVSSSCIVGVAGLTRSPIDGKTMIGLQDGFATRHFP